MGTKKKPARQSRSYNRPSNNNQSSFADAYYRQQQWLKWAAIAIFILLLLLLLLAGYATDWLQGTRRDALLDSATANTTGTSGGGGTTVVNPGAGGTNTNTSSTERIIEGGTDVTRESNNSSNSSSETTKETNTTTPGENQPLIDLFDDVSVGDNLNDLQVDAGSLGVGMECHTEVVLVELCDFSVGEFTVSTKSVGGVITSITDNF